MRVKHLHDWQLSIHQAMDLQRQLANQVSKNNKVSNPRYIAGVDISVYKTLGIARGAVVVLSYPELRVVESQVVEGKVDFPYVPGLLSFRELPITLAACERLNITPDLVLVDGQGIAHPRRFGLASHLGLFLDIPTIGCAKSRLCGSHEDPGLEPGSYAEISHADEVIGVALRTRYSVKPVYVSIGHKVDLQTAVHWVLMCCHHYRLPEPTRLAHLAAGGHQVGEKDLVASGVNH